MSIYLQLPGESPEIVWLSHWSIRESADGTRHFVGYSRETRNGRVSTRILHLDGATHTAQTLSGRIYQLVGPTVYHADAEFVFNTVAKGIGGGKAWRDATAELIPDCRGRRRAIAKYDEVKLEAAARLLCLSRAYMRSLVRDGKVPGRLDEDGAGVQWIPIDALIGDCTRMRADMKGALEALMSESQRLGLYNYDPDLPLRPASSDEAKE
ncbi:hypothetical protein [Paraburkholderia nodosa]|uniref:hypothetical protein n=1 Tax=Paraburkholderia nodosa TaxID=392320 RepID=UPI0006872BB5|nr:hypothetical protein [Paraburkholderia nodosa]